MMPCQANCMTNQLTANEFLTIVWRTIHAANSVGAAAPHLRQIALQNESDRSLSIMGKVHNPHASPLLNVCKAVQQARVHMTTSFHTQMQMRQMHVTQTRLHLTFLECTPDVLIGWDVERVTCVRNHASYQDSEFVSAWPCSNVTGTACLNTVSVLVSAT